MRQEKMNVINHRYRLKYHISANGGWINDPNGFCYFNGYYHIFYQHYPYDSKWGPMHWGHSRSKDLVHWEQLPIALYPDTEGVDEGGCFSGSAIVKDGKLYLIYTGHHYYGDGDNDHFWENQNIAVSDDGINFTKLPENPIIQAPPGDSTHHFRDPKVWQEGEDYFLILGNQNQEEKGRVLIYRSSDLINWNLIAIPSQATTMESEGFMWECPDFFKLQGQDILLLSPQGILSQKRKFRNLFQTGYFTGKFDKTKGVMTRGVFKELDFGHDFYATQTTLAPDGRRLLIAWMAMWESNMPEQEDGWAGALIFPRELSLKQDRLYMMPVRELKYLRTVKLYDEALNRQHDTVILNKECSSCEIDITLDRDTDFSLLLHNDEKTTQLKLTYDSNYHQLVLSRTDRQDDDRYAELLPCNNIHIKVLLDKSSMEIFVNNGEVVFTERYYIEQEPILNFGASDDCRGHYVVYELDKGV